MLLMLCLMIVAVFHLDEVFFAFKGHPHRPKAYCGLIGEPMFSDPDGRKVYSDPTRLSEK